ncbi:hypothetical protein [Alkalicoccus luteus]|uniref:YneQ n=1 Tax=Alkalicoccus luteus TaxID=1237094 RepID=A0A969TUQ8_9BACI|nr:hypothetical protein [Alkalicoccus luteus]NJP37221.1 hypothetical protein [Alkalicoccus luteus]
MAFGVTKQELAAWKHSVRSGKVAFLTHFWYDRRFPQYNTVTKAACSDRSRLIEWGLSYGLRETWIHEERYYPHFDLIGADEFRILQEEGELEKLLKLRSRAGNDHERMI